MLYQFLIGSIYGFQTSRTLTFRTQAFRTLGIANSNPNCDSNANPNP